MKFTSPSMGEVGAKRRAGAISESLKGGFKRKSNDQAARRDTDEHGWFECFAKQKFLSVSSVFIRVLHETRGPVTQLSGNLL
jgi:hypothetical protein